jgi:hypothetical protein
MLTRPALLLRVEEVALFTAVVLLYAHLHFSWLLFGVLFLTPDLSMLGYLLNPHAGAVAYNLGHTLTLPLCLFLAGAGAHRPLVLALALIWVAHIAFDRLLGYGLKYPAHFKDTHLQCLA